MNWRITPSPPDAGDRAGVRLQVAGDDPQQRRLAGAVGADQRDLGALADPERHVVEQHPPVGQLEPDAGDIHVAHPPSLTARPPPRPPRYRLPVPRNVRGREILPQTAGSISGSRASWPVSSAVPAVPLVLEQAAVRTSTAATGATAE